MEKQTETRKTQQRRPGREYGDSPAGKRLRRDMEREMLARLEDAARTEEDFREITEWWDRLDENRERRERYHELSRSGDDLPLEYGAAEDGAAFPEHLSSVLWRQARSGDFIDMIFFCPYELHELVTEEYISNILRGLTDDQKALFFTLAVLGLGTARIAAIRGQTDRNIRKKRAVIHKRIEDALLAALMERGPEKLTREERCFLSAHKGIDMNNGGE